jgi:pimeloyl-ACP methyl ester carboxylesterase
MDVPVDGGTLNVLRFGDGPNVVLAAHGITASGMAYGAVARHLPDGWTLLAPDLRGRGGSSALPGPYGLQQHARDVIAVAATVDRPVVLAGHSMGAYVSVLAAALRPDLFERVVLIDGGLPLPVPAGADFDQVLAATLGPMLQRLTRTFPDERAYLDFFRAHPALGPNWNDDVEAYVRYDLTGPAGAMRSKASPDAVTHDGRDLLGMAAAMATSLHALRPPTLLLTAPTGMFGDPPGFMPDELVQRWRGELPALRTELLPDTNHYTILLSPDAAKTIAARLTDPSTWP